MYAHLYKTKGGYELLITTTPGLDGATLRRTVEGKREARKLTAEHGAKCWNF